MLNFSFRKKVRAGRVAPWPAKPVARTGVPVLVLKPREEDYHETMALPDNMMAILNMPQAPVRTGLAGLARWFPLRNRILRWDASDALP